MVGNSTKNRLPLLPDRHPIQDFFIADITDAIPKDDIGSMEHPIFSLATKPDVTIREYDHNGTSVKIIPSALGMATIHDKDVLIYCISQLVAGIKKGATPNKTLHIKAYDLLVSTNRSVDGRGYEQLIAALTRLKGTMITTNLATGGVVPHASGFGLINDFEIVPYSNSSRMAELKVSLSNWLYNAATSKQVLTLHRDYFRLRKPLERRIYELARKHCGQQYTWAISLPLLKKKTGSSSSDKEFRRLVNEICEENAIHQHMPDYDIMLEEDNVRFNNRDTMPKASALPSPVVTDFPILDAETYNEARTVAPTYDIYALEQAWHEFWIDSGKPSFANPDAAFIGFCRSRYERKPNP